MLEKQPNNKNSNYIIKDLSSLLNSENGLTLNMSCRCETLQIAYLSLRKQKYNESNYKHNTILIFIIIPNNSSNPFHSLHSSLLTNTCLQENKQNKKKLNTCFREKFLSAQPISNLRLDPAINTVEGNIDK